MDALPELPVDDLDTWFLRAIQKKTVSNGLAILIGCPSSHLHSDPLEGVEKDLKALLMTFERLMFTTLCLNDPPANLIKAVVNCVSKLDKTGLKLPEMWNTIVFAFSGHGQANCLFTIDSHVDLQEDIVDPLLPENAQGVARLPKLFFIDACRGPNFDPGIKITWDHSERVATRGGSPRVSSRGGYLIAFSTLKGMQALEYTEFGGFWMQFLAQELVDGSNVDKTIYDILTNVNGKMEDLCIQFEWPMQQPVIDSALNKSIKLLREAAGKYLAKLAC